MKTATRIGTFVRTYLVVGAAISALAIIQTETQTQALLKLRTRYKWVILMAVFAVNLVLGVVLGLRGSDVSLRWRNAVSARANRWLAGFGGVMLLLLPVPAFLVARQDFFGRDLEGFFRLLWLFWLLVLAQAAGLRILTRSTWQRAMAGCLLLDGLAAQLFTLSTGVSAYPFSIGWSEASRYYYGSLVFAKSLYGERLPLSVMHGTRYLLQSVPFLAWPAALWVSRSWQVLLWIALTAMACYSAVRRLALRNWMNAVMVAAWLFLFFFQGAVYYHLQVCVILILLGVSTKQPGRSLPAVVVASIWAGMSRVNWFPVPAMIAITLYLLETPYRAPDNIWRYCRTPALWGLAGLASAVVGQALYVAISGNTNLQAFASSFTSALLWYRWWPSATNPIGIIPGIAIASAPALAIITWRVKSEWREVHRLRLIAIAVLLLMLLAGGLVVSTKIGGGGDLHNLDAYLVLFAIVGAYSLTGRVAPDQRGRKSGEAPPWPMIAVLLLVPVAFSLMRLGARFAYDAERAAADLSSLGKDVEQYSRNGEVLFMYERHLQAFGMVPPVKMVPEYEVVTLMEMAISRNQRYLDQFYGDLKAHRFAAIVAHPQNLGVETGDFIEENDAWNELVAKPLLCQYKPALTLQYSKVQILVPRERPCPDPPLVLLQQ